MLYYIILYFVLYPLINPFLTVYFPFNSTGWMTEALFTIHFRTSRNAKLSPELYCFIK
jgi:hypothetical protein